MNSYKLVNSEEIQKKAFRLGYEKIVNPNACFLFMCDTGVIGTELKDWNYYSNHPFQEITQSDFLALPEPIKVGDWGIVKNVVFKKIIGKVTWISDNQLEINYIKQCIVLEEITKLTPEQIKVLGLGGLNG